MRAIEIRCLSNYEFCANPKQTLQTNFNNAIRAEPSTLYSQPTNLTYHNLCTKHPTPLGTKHLLGLNLNCCLAFHQLPNDVNKMILKMAYSFRTKHYLISNTITTDSDYIKQIYKRNTTWNPSPAPNLIEEK
jgi:hypothetical protein